MTGSTIIRGSEVGALPSAVTLSITLAVSSKIGRKYEVKMQPQYCKNETINVLRPNLTR